MIVVIIINEMAEAYFFILIIGLIENGFLTKVSIFKEFMLYLYEPKNIKLWQSKVFKAKDLNLKKRN